jgi:branched-subunit amino acid aminotransferase/4-amino-4-deoxychorismate lyase
MRAFLLENAPKYGIKIVEKTLKKADFSTAEAIMTSNAVTGLSVSNAVSFDTSLKERLDAMFADLLS